MHPRCAPRENPRRGRSPFLVVQRIVKGRFETPLDRLSLHRQRRFLSPWERKGGWTSLHRTAPRKNEPPGGVEPRPYGVLGKLHEVADGCAPNFMCLRHNPSVSFADSIPTLFVPSGHFPLIGGIDPLHKGALVRAMHQHHAPRENPRRGRSPFLVGQRFAKGRSKLPLAVFLYTASGAFFPHGKKAGLSLRRCTVPCNTHRISQCFT